MAKVLALGEQATESTVRYMYGLGLVGVSSDKDSGKGTKRAAKEFLRMCLYSFLACPENGHTDEQ